MRRILTRRVPAILLALIWSLTCVTAAAAGVSNERELAFELLRQLEQGNQTYSFQYTGKMNYENVLSYIECGTSQYVSGFTYYGKSPDTMTLKIPDAARHEQSVKQAKEAVKLVIKADMPVREKYRALHDWLVTHCQYGESEMYDGQSAYCALILGEALCAGYAKAYLLLCREAGLPCAVVTGSVRDTRTKKTTPHAWNIISLDGQWLYVDPTWDDPYPDVANRVTHDFFALTRKEISKTHTPTRIDVETFAAYLNPHRVDMAEALGELGLLRPGENGYDLESKPTRGQGAVMLTRLLGEEQTALQHNNSHPFTDVPEWLTPYVGFLAQKGLSNGVSVDRFGSQDSLTLTQYLTFVLRSLGYQDGKDFRDPITLANRIGLLPEGLAEAAQYAGRGFYRGDMAAISYQALQCRLKGSAQTLLDILQSKGAVNLVPPAA